MLADLEYAYSDMQNAAGYRTLLGVPLLSGNEPIGVLFLGRKTVEPFTEKQIELVQTFADQAVIAIENVRLFDEVQAKTRDLTESLQQQTATADVLKVISASPGELEPVFQAMLENAVRLCEAKFAMLFLYEENQFRAVGQWNLPPAYREYLAKSPIRADPKIPLGRVAMTKQAVQVADLPGVDQSYLERFAGSSASSNSEAPGRYCRYPCSRRTSWSGQSASIGRRSGPLPINRLRWCRISQPVA